jgi:hypothetical protein
LSKFSFACQRFIQHSKISHETEQRVFESGRFVFLKEKVPNPCKAVSDNEHSQKVGDREIHYASDQHNDGQQSSDCVQSFVGLVGVL